jgi:translation initiation factor 6
MPAAKCIVKGSDYIGAFATANDKYVFLGMGINRRAIETLRNVLMTDVIEFTMFATDLVGLFVKSNSNGILISNLVDEREIEMFKKHDIDINMEILDSGLNAIGNNILVNDKIALINPDYSSEAQRQIRDVLDVEVVKHEIGGYKTVGANSILTNKGFVISNRASDQEKEELDKLLGFDSIRTTANMGSLSIGLAAVCNSHGVVVGDNTTGYELTRITDALEIND